MLSSPCPQILAPAFDLPSIRVYPVAMRLTSGFLVSALIRRVFDTGGFASVERKGALQAGAIFIRHRHRDGLESLYGPAPQAMMDGEDSADRLFELRLDRVDAEEIRALLEREIRFDSDLWVVELECETVRDLFDVADMPPSS